MFHVKQKTEYFFKKYHEKFEEFVKILFEWQKNTNLISKNTINDVWNRHIFDSIQIYGVLGDKKYKNYLDVGTGGGFPGLMMSIVDNQMSENYKFEKIVLVDSNLKKCLFLREVVRKMSLKRVEVKNVRVENIDEKFDLITSRAVAECVELLKMTSNCSKKETQYLFLKGENVDEELSRLKKYRDLKVEKINSLTSLNSYIVRISRGNNE